MYVVLFHINGYITAKLPALALPGGFISVWLMNGNKGVLFFFVLSGFIVSLPFARNKDGKTPSARSYYLRRLTRIEPPYIIALTLIFFGQLAFNLNPYGLGLTEQLKHYAASIFYAHGLIYHHMPIITAVAWSLEVEIQFYLLGPLLFKLFRQNVAVRYLVWSLLIAVCALLPNYISPVFRNIYGYGQFFIAGMIAADLFANYKAIEKLHHPLWIAASALLFGYLCYTPIHFNWLTQLTYAPLVGVFLLTCICNPSIKKAIGNKVTATIGGICYSIYLLHFTIISFVGNLIMKHCTVLHGIGGYTVFAAALLLAILIVSVAFYLTVEKPFMNKRIITEKSGTNEAVSS